VQVLAVREPGTKYIGSIQNCRSTMCPDCIDSLMSHSSQSLIYKGDDLYINDEPSLLSFRVKSRKSRKQIFSERIYLFPACLGCSLILNIGSCIFLGTFLAEVISFHVKILVDFQDIGRKPLNRRIPVLF